MTSAAISQAMLMVNNFVDPFASYVVSLLHFDGGVVDSIVSGPTWSLSGAAVITTDPTRILTGSGALDASGSNSSNVSGGSPGIAVGTQDLCAELWTKDSLIGTASDGILLMQSASTSQTIRLFGGVGVMAADISGGGPSGSVTFPIGVWNHTAITRFGNNWTLWLNGVAAQTWTNATFNGGSGIQIWIGSSSSSNSGRQCYHDEWRFTLGVPRYTAPFTPSYPFPNP